MISAFLLGFITLPIPGEPELRRGVNSYQVRKNTLTETYPSSPHWHLHLNLLFLKDADGESSSLCITEAV